MSEDFFEVVGTLANGRIRPTTQPAFGGVSCIPEQPPSLSTGTAARWAQSDNRFYGVAQTHDTLPPGAYRVDIHPNLGPMLCRMEIKTDDLLRLPDSASEAVLDEIRLFRSMEARFREHGFLYKRGYLLWGPPGSGKTATVNQVQDLLVREEGGIALFVDHPTAAAMGLQLVRRIEPDRPVLAILEDLDSLVQKYGESEYLALLDGEAQVDNVLYLASTNYPEVLDRRFVDRPSRIDTIRFIGMPSPAAREAYLLAKAPFLLVNGRLEEYVRLSDGFSIAHLRELVVLTQVFGRPLEESATRLRAMKVTPKSSAGAAGAGFGGER